MRREYPTKPIVGVGAVIISSGKMLLAKRGSEPGKGKWSIPGGLVELGEMVRHTVVREVKEECDL
ncbi:MAG: NUDIX domain-containing protein, partial [Candidatus Bathyarchaeum sp.]